MREAHRCWRPSVDAWGSTEPARNPWESFIIVLLANIHAHAPTPNTTLSSPLSPRSPCSRVQPNPDRDQVKFSSKSKGEAKNHISFICGFIHLL